MASSILDALPHVDALSIAILLPLLAGLGLVVPYLADPYCIRSNGVTGPVLARFSDLWLGWVAAQGHRSEVVHELHKKYGTFVRLAPNHVSVSDPDALQVVYAHGGGTLKADFYDAFVSIRRGLFNTRSRAEHTRKRKIVAHIFAPKEVRAFEPYVRQHVRELLARWDALCEGGAKGLAGDDGEGGWRGRDGRVCFNCLPWYNYLAFDIIGDLAFGSPFGMIQAGKDAAPVAKDTKAAIAGYGGGAAGAGAAPAVTELAAVQVLNDRGEYSAAMGVLPPRCAAVQNLAGLAVAAVAKRLACPTERTDLLSKLQEGKDDAGAPMGREELTAEALTQLIAGSDTTSNSSCAITYYIARNPQVQAKLHAELDGALGADDDAVADAEAVKRLPYLAAVIDETLRLHSTSGIGLPRVAPPGGLSVLGRAFPAGTVLSVPSYTVHRDARAWGADAGVFRPERWFERDPVEMQRAFNPFSVGPRACVGRNLASMELLVIVASVFRRYEFVLEEPDKPVRVFLFFAFFVRVHVVAWSDRRTCLVSAQLETCEGFLRKPVECRVGVKRRDV
ncbi:cytochrome P450 monooxygenase pc-bph [Phellopilus nigrolimitatus]|nr:cytochrome P450 monooxygenase pc-bph [Phellopilus nigrolimitatus]